MSDCQLSGGGRDRYTKREDKEHTVDRGDGVQYTEKSIVAETAKGYLVEKEVKQTKIKK